MIEFRNVYLKLDGTQILDDLDLQIEQGEVLILLGASGCGKTTSLKLINRLIDPTEGEVLVEGKPTVEWNPIDLRRRVGYVLQEGGLFPHFTVAENVGIPQKLLGKTAAGSLPRVLEMLSLVGLDPKTYADRFPHELSGGQRQRVGVARALAADPELLLLDEPFGALDAITRMKIQTEFSALVRKLGKTAVFVTHDLHEAMLLGTRIALMDNGQIVFVGTPMEFRDAKMPLAKEYLATISV